MDGMSRDMGTIQTEEEHRRLFDDAMERHMGKPKRPVRFGGTAINGLSFEQLLAMMRAGGRL